MRGSVLASGIAHGALMVFLLIVRAPMNAIVPGPEVVQVALVDPSAPVAPVPEPPQQQAPEAPPEIKPEQDEGVKIAPERPRPKKKEEKPAPRPEPQPVAAPTLPSAKVGSSGLSGDLSVESSNFEFTYYLMLVRNQIASRWTPPSGLSTGGNPVRAVVYFRVGRGGEITGIRIETGSGLEFFDRSALRAVTVSDPLPPLPLGFAGGDLGIHFGFDWESP
jgi:TonB family protein